MWHGINNGAAGSWQSVRKPERNGEAGLLLAGAQAAKASKQNGLAAAKRRKRRSKPATGSFFSGVAKLQRRKY